jgi:hypothetical protein
MSDKLEQYIRANRAELDSFEPDGMIWERIDKDLRPRQVKTMRRRIQVWAVAATVTLLGVTLGVLGIQDGAPIIIAQESPIEKVLEESYTPELAEIESYYHSVIEDQQSQLVSFQEEGIVLDESGSFGLEQLQAMYKDLRKELAYGEDKDVVVNAMIENLMMQMDLLRQQLMIMENIKVQRNEQAKEVHL